MTKLTEAQKRKAKAEQALAQAERMEAEAKEIVQNEHKQKASAKFLMIDMEGKEAERSLQEIDTLITQAELVGKASAKVLAKGLWLVYNSDNYLHIEHKEGGALITGFESWKAYLQYKGISEGRGNYLRKIAHYSVSYALLDTSGVMEAKALAEFLYSKEIDTSKEAQAEGKEAWEAFNSASAKAERKAQAEAKAKKAEAKAFKKTLKEASLKPKSLLKVIRNSLLNMTQAERLTTLPMLVVIIQEFKKAEAQAEAQAEAPQEASPTGGAQSPQEASPQAKQAQALLQKAEAEIQAEAKRLKRNEAQKLRRLKAKKEAEYAQAKAEGLIKPIVHAEAQAKA